MRLLERPTTVAEFEAYVRRFSSSRATWLRLETVAWLLGRTSREVYARWRDAIIHRDQTGARVGSRMVPIWLVRRHFAQLAAPDPTAPSNPDDGAPRAAA